MMGFRDVFDVAGILQENIKRRRETDELLSTAWCMLPIVGLVVALSSFLIGYLIFRDFFLFYLLTLIATVIYGGLALYLLYVLIDRRNKHFARALSMFMSLSSSLEELAEEKNIDVTTQLTIMRGYLSYMRMEEGKRSPLIWCALYLIPVVNVFVILYIFYFLTRDWYAHERREDAVWEQINHALTSVGYEPIDVSRAEPIPSRNFALYTILYFLAGLIWATYWLYVLVSDPNEHLKAHIRMEDELLTRLRALSLA